MSPELTGILVAQMVMIVIAFGGGVAAYFRFRQQIKIDAIGTKGEANLDNANALSTIQEASIKMAVSFMESNSRVLVLQNKVDDMERTLKAQAERIGVLEESVEAERSAKIELDKTASSLRSLLDDETRKRHKVEDERESLRIERDALQAELTRLKTGQQ